MRRAIPALLETTTVRAAADKAGLSESTIYRYLRNEHFQAELRRRQDALLAASTANLVGKTGDVLTELYRIALGGDKESVKVQAIRTWLQNMTNAIELQELVERVEALEIAVSEQD
jgi:AcrR family transcriptional regulator